MKILMFNPPYGDNFCRSARWASKSRGRVQRHPDYMLIATKILENAGHKVCFIDGAALNLKEEQIMDKLKEFSPEMVVIHTTTPSIYSDIKYANLCKTHSGAFTVLIGAHASAEIEDTFRNGNYSVDVIAKGEYDYILKDLANGKDWRDILGISYFDQGEIHYNPPRQPLDVNELPFPAWYHIKPEWYPAGSKRLPFLTLLSGRGCNGLCTFCRETQVMFGRRLRLRDPEIVVDEIEYDYRLFPKIKEIMFETDTFTASPNHVRGVCNEILRRNLKITWSCNVRVDVKLELLTLMKRAGCRMLMVGFEFGTQESLDSVKKGTTVEQSIKFAETAHRLGFIIHGCFMIGRPGETHKSARATIDFAKRLPCDTIQISGICVYPGTEMYRWAKENHYLTPKDWTEWVNDEREQVTVLSYPQLSKKEIDELIDHGLREFYSRPKQMLKMGLNIRSLGDLKMKLHGLKSYIDYFKYRIS